MNKFKKISRRKFVQRGGLVLLIPVLYAWYEVVKTEKLKSEPTRIRINEYSITQGLSFHDRVIIHRENDKMRVFEAKCTHLGCKINQEIEGAMVCACHGSRFDQNGNPINGPAVKPLKELQFRHDKLNEVLIIEL